MPSDTRFEYTMHMENIFREKMSDLESYYCREDFELALDDVDQAAKDAKQFRMKALKKLCDARGIDAKELLTDRTKLAEIPTREQMQEKSLWAFYDMYANAPKTTDFMERIVRRLASEYKDDPVFERKAVELDEAGVIRLIADRMAKYRNDETLDVAVPELSEETVKKLDELLAQSGLDAPGDSDFDKIQKLAAALGTKTVPETCMSRIPTLSVCLENDFRAQLRKIPRVSRTGQVGNAAELYKQAKKDEVKKLKAAAKKNELDYELLAMCNDLAAGNFRVNGKTKVYLYYFAFMFGMTVPLAGKEYDPERQHGRNHQDRGYCDRNPL